MIDAERIAETFPESRATCDIETLFADRDEYINVAIGVFRAHPEIWAACQLGVALRQLGDRDALRKAKSGLEKGIKRPISDDQWKQAVKIQAWLDRHNRPTLAEARKLLIAAEIIKKMSPENFRKLVVKHGLRDRFQ